MAVGVRCFGGHADERDLDTDETMLVGWVTNERAKLSKAAETYIEKLKSVVADHGYKLID